MRRVIVTLAFVVLLVLQAGTAWATPRGNPFCRMAGTPTHLAHLVQQSLNKDSSGNTPLSPTACHQVRPATPHDFLVVLKESDPQRFATMTVAELPAYFRSLIKVKVHGEYLSACLVLRHSGWQPFAACEARHLRPHEMAWVDPQTRRPVLQGDCANPMQGRVPPNGCVYVLLPVQKGDEIRVKDYGPRDIAAMPCTGVKRAGETIYESLFLDRCPDSTCSFWGADQVVGNDGWETGSWREQASGWTLVRLPAVEAQKDSGYRVFFCLRHENGQQSCGLGVRWFDYRLRQVTRTFKEKVAIIFPNARAAQGEATRVGTQSDLWWHFNLDNCGG